MPRGRSKNGCVFTRGRQQAEEAQNALIEKQVAELRRRTAEQALNIQVKKVATQVTMGDVTYGKANVVSPFTAKDMITALDADGTIDMSGDLGADVSHETLIQRMLFNCENDEPFICLYVRNVTTTARFALLQRHVEMTFNFPVQKDLQGWILHYGKMFIFGGVNHTLECAVNKIMQSFHKELIEYVEKQVLAEITQDWSNMGLTEHSDE